MVHHAIAALSRGETVDPASYYEWAQGWRLASQAAP